MLIQRIVTILLRHLVKLEATPFPLRGGRANEPTFGSVARKEVFVKVSHMLNINGTECVCVCLIHIIKTLLYHGV